MKLIVSYNNMENINNFIVFPQNKMYNANVKYLQ